jgi:hypothetical protein
MHEISNFMNFNVSKVSVPVSVSVSRYFRKLVPLTVSPIEKKVEYRYLYHRYYFKVSLTTLSIANDKEMKNKNMLQHKIFR